MSVGESALRNAELAARYEELAPRGVRYAHSILRNRADSEEVVQEAFCRLLRADKRPEQLNGSFAPLFFATVRNLCIDLRRVTGRRGHVSLSGGQVDLAVTEPTNDADELEQQITRAIQVLPSNWADALKLKIDGELSYDQIAEVLHCTHAQVRTWIYRARQQLAEQLLSDSGDA